MALQRFTVNVTKADIDSGEREDCAFCPVARGIRRAIGIGGVTVTGEFFGYGVDQAAAFDCCSFAPVRLPLEARRFIEYFDNGDTKNAKPFDFEIEIDPSLTCDDLTIDLPDETMSQVVAEKLT